MVLDVQFALKAIGEHDFQFFRCKDVGCGLWAVLSEIEQHIRVSRTVIIPRDRCTFYPRLHPPQILVRKEGFQYCQPVIEDCSLNLA
jgi:hypothetical protein